MSSNGIFYGILGESHLGLFGCWELPKMNKRRVGYSLIKGTWNLGSRAKKADLIVSLLSCKNISYTFRQKV